MGQPVAPGKDGTVIKLDVSVPTKASKPRRCDALVSFCRTPPVFVERMCKIVTAVVLFLVTTAILIAAFANVTSSTSTWDIATTKPIIVSLSGCHLGVHSVPGSSRTVAVDISQRGGISLLDIGRSGGADVSVIDCEDSTRILCTSNASPASGRLAAVSLAIGAGVPVSTLNLTVVSTGASRASVTAEGVSATAVDISGANMVAMLKYLTLDTLTTDIDFGVLDVRHTAFTAASVVVDTASVGVVHDTPLVLSMSGSNLSTNLCLTSDAGAPSVAAPAAITVGDTTGMASVPTLTVTRSASTAEAQGSVFVSASNNATVALRTAATTSSTLIAAKDVVTVEDDLSSTSADLPEGFDVVRLQLVGAGLLDPGASSSRDWVWTSRDVMLWFPLPAAQALSVRAFTASTFRKLVVLQDTPCILPTIETLDASVCPIDGTNTITTSTLVSEASTTYDSLYTALKTASESFFNESGRLVQLTVEPRSERVMRILSADYALSRHSMVGFVSNGLGGAQEEALTTDGVRSAAGDVYVPIYILLSVTGAFIGTVLAVGWGRTERRKWLKNWGPAYFQEDWDKHRSACLNKIGPLFFLDQLVADVNPRFIALYGLPTSFFTVLLHWLAVSLTVFAMLGIGVLFNSADVRHLWCSWGSLVGAAAPAVDYCFQPAHELAWFCFVYSAVFTAYSFVYVLLYYAEFSADPPCGGMTSFTEKPHIHAGFNYLWLGALFCVFLYALNVVLWLMLLALIHPERYVHILLGIFMGVWVVIGLYRRAAAFREKVRAEVLDRAMKRGDQLLSGLKGVKRNVDGLLSKYGYSKRDILVFTIVSAIMITALITFVLVGLAVFAPAESVFATVIRSIAVFAAASSVALARNPSKGLPSLRVVQKIDSKLEQFDAYSEAACNGVSKLHKSTQPAQEDQATVEALASNMEVEHKAGSDAKPQAT